MFPVEVQLDCIELPTHGDFELFCDHVGRERHVSDVRMREYWSRSSLWESIDPPPKEMWRQWPLWWYIFQNDDAVVEPANSLDRVFGKVALEELRNRICCGKADGKPQ